jgi:intracellular septation protein
VKLLADLLPVIVFFVVYQLDGIYAATVAAIAASIAQVVYLRIRTGRIETLHAVTLGLLVLFGGMTLLLHDPAFIKWKPTVVNWLFATAFLGSQLWMRRSLLQRIMDHAVTLPDTAWSRLNLAWVVFFFVMGALNIYVAYHFSEAVWVNFKLFGMLALTLVFLVAQGLFLSRYLASPETRPED